MYLRCLEKIFVENSNAWYFNACQSSFLLNILFSVRIYDLLIVIFHTTEKLIKPIVCNPFICQLITVVSTKNIKLLFHDRYPDKICFSTIPEQNLTKTLKWDLNARNDKNFDLSLAVKGRHRNYANAILIKGFVSQQFAN